MMRRLHWICAGPSPYNDVLFRELSKSPQFDLYVYYMSANNAPNRWNLGNVDGYHARALRNRPVDFDLLRSVLSDPGGVLLTACWQEPSSQLLLSILIARRRPYFIWNDTPTPHRRNWIKEQLRAAFLKKVFQNAERVLGTGEMALSAFAEMGATRDKLINFPYCIDLKRFSPHPFSGIRRPFTFGTCARLVHLKGIDVALRALAMLKTSVSQPIHYRIAGAGPEESRLRRQAADLGLQDEVEFLGWLSQDDLPDFYRSLLCYVHPARFEPYGVTVLEALACGIPVIASHQTAAALDRLHPGNGALHRAGDDVDLLRAMKGLLQLSDLDRAGMSREARRAAQSWTPREALATIEDIVAGLDPGARHSNTSPVETFR